ncbi:TonB-dependent siderophore receptor [Olivibacter sp. SDN3]|uniref:TonB-dependent receptor n=1 Tax=Olivibacter sp. SDN3 TaxID=2764720 RepID=UPI00165165CF|nr:TonB-dependent receptor [Olivibacter sp. SDN3]QNL50879.1 TonB-dependent siderophore receptor [Olivibacter sp. SDN3]
MRIFSTVVFLLLSIVGAYAQTVSLTGRVTGSQGNGLSAVTLRVDQYVTQTSTNGYFSFSEKVQLPATIRVTAVGYAEQTIGLDSSFSASEGLSIQLAPADVALEEVLVTGRRNNSYLVNTAELGGKFSGILKDLPQSVSLVSREFMEDRQAFVITDMVQDLAGVNQASAYDDLTIRGFNSGYTSGLRLVNGMRSAYGYGTSFWRTPMTANLESIEVLKGPGASLFGDIVPGGTVNLVTKRPLEEQKTSIGFAVGSFQTLRSTLDMGGPLDQDKKFLYRLNIAYENSRTFRDNNQRKNILVAPSFTFRPAEGTQIDVDLTYDDFDGFLDRGLVIRNNDFYAQDRAFNVNQPTDFYRSKFLSFSTRFSQHITHDLSIHVNYMKSIYSEDLNEFRTLNTFANPPQNTIMNMRFLSKNVKDYTDNLVSYLSYNFRRPGHDHRLVFGVDYAQYGGDRNNVQREARRRMLDGEEVPLTIDLEKPVRDVIDVGSYLWLDQAEFPFLNPYRSYGFYLQDQMTIGSRLHLIMGLRHEYYRSSSADLAQSYETTQHSWLPRFGLTYQINHQMNYFASYSQGYVPVGADFIHNYEQYGADRPFGAERSFQVETGLKTGFFDNQLQTELSLFHISRQNMMIASGEISDSGFPVYRQSGEVISRGVELDFRGQITREFQVMANYSFNHTEVKASSIASEVGMPLANAPKHMGGLWMKYVIPNAALKGLGFGAGTNFVSGRRMENPVTEDADGNQLWDEWPAYQVWNAAVYYYLRGVRLTLNLNNITDKYYYLGGFDYTRGFVGTPRNVMLSMGFSF